MANLALVILTGCVPARISAPTPVDLLVSAPRGALSTALEAAAAAYTQAAGVRVRVEALGGEEYTRQVSAALLAGLERYDLVVLSAEDLPRWAGYHAIQPLSGSLDTTALGPWLPAVTVSGQVYGLPTQPDPQVLWYRIDLLKAAGLSAPPDWETLSHDAALLNRDSPRIGMVVAGSDIDAGVDFAAVLAGFGGEMVNAQYQVKIDGDTSRRALEMYTALSQPGADHFTRADVLAALREGRAALGVASYSAGSQLLDCTASPKVCGHGLPLLAWTRLPGLTEHQAVGSLSAWSIPLHAAHAGQAQRFAAWLGGEAGARAWAQAGGVPANTVILNDLERQHPLSQVSFYRLAFPPVGTVDLLWKACNTAVNAAVSGKQPPSRALATAAVQMRQALSQAGYRMEE